MCIISDICKFHLQLDFCRIPYCRVILEQKHAATTAAITNEETEMLEQLTAVTVACKEETIDSTDKELLALIRKKEKMDRKDKAQVRDISKKINQTVYQRQQKIQKT